MIENGLEMMVVYKKCDKPSRRPNQVLALLSTTGKASIFMRIQRSKLGIQLEGNTLNSVTVAPLPPLAPPQRAENRSQTPNAMPRHNWTVR